MLLNKLHNKPRQWLDRGIMKEKKKEPKKEKKHDHKHEMHEPMKMPKAPHKKHK